jgi:hypothetical protein
MGVKSKLQNKSVYRRSAWLAAPLAAVLAITGAPAMAATPAPAAVAAAIVPLRLATTLLR